MRDPISQFLIDGGNIRAEFTAHVTPVQLRDTERLKHSEALIEETALLLDGTNVLAYHANQTRICIVAADDGLHSQGIYILGSYQEPGTVRIDGITTASFVPASAILEWHYNETGSVAVDGDVYVRREIHRAEAGNIVVDGITAARPSRRNYSEAGNILLDGIVAANPQVSNTTAVAQVAGEFAVTGAPPLAVSQVAGEFLTTGAPPIRISQTAAEFVSSGLPPLAVSQVASEHLIMGLGTLAASQVAAEFLVANWKRKQDFMPVLARLMEER